MGIKPRILLSYTYAISLTLKMVYVRVGLIYLNSGEVIFAGVFFPAGQSFLKLAFYFWFDIIWPEYKIIYNTRNEMFWVIRFEPVTFNRSKWYHLATKCSLMGLN